jgi:hypothetical protein
MSSNATSERRSEGEDRDEQERVGKVEVLARVKSRQLRVVDAAVLIGGGYQEAKRLWKRYGEGGAASLKHRSARRRSNGAYAEKFRHKVLGSPLRAPRGCAPGKASDKGQEQKLEPQRGISKEL